ncbi:PhzF family phenazine biosynthesis protein [Kiloniella sp.]|uniref:PhzF family phenazine biosynthesis protein n=1 Tax=Kiloniella sp. TaxID=1938587 RepID=UPI003A8CC4D3
MSKSTSEVQSATSLVFASYDAFTDVPYSGSQSAVILGASGISEAHRAKIAKEIGAPATSFVDDVSGNRVKVQFFSTVMELPMCGHGTVCLITRLVENNLLKSGGEDWNEVILDLPKGPSVVQYRRNTAGRCEVMLNVTPADYSPAEINMDVLAKLLGVDCTAFSQNLPVEVATGDFIHLCLPLRNCAAMNALQPDFGALADFCIANNLETIATFSTETVNPDRNIHVRDFCPAVGVAESAAAGTTNAALAGYLWRNNLITPNSDGLVTVQAEQGIKLGRPSHVTSHIATTKGLIKRIQVGGVASKIIEGFLNTKMDAA